MTAAGVALVAATRLEARAARRACPGVPVHVVGVGARRPPPVVQGRLLLSVGVCGALEAGMAPGTVAVPGEVGLLDGGRVPCDPAAVAALRTAARTAGVPLTEGPLLAAVRPVTGAARGAAAAAGWAVADMETGVLLAAGHRVAAVRAIVDCPEREIPPEMTGTWAVLLRPWLWPAAARLASPARAAAARSAAVAAAALGLGWDGEGAVADPA